MAIPGGNITTSTIWTQPTEPVEPVVEEVVEEVTEEVETTDEN